MTICFEEYGPHDSTQMRAIYGLAMPHHGMCKLMVNIWLLFGKTQTSIVMCGSPHLSPFNNAIGCFVSSLIPIGGLLKF